MRLAIWSFSGSRAPAIRRHVGELIKIIFVARVIRRESVNAAKSQLAHRGKKVFDKFIAKLLEQPEFKPRLFGRALPGRRHDDRAAPTSASKARRTKRLKLNLHE